uniref:Cephalosporin C regulator 1 n=1 Tax=Hapsidospora chrysogena TaxID=5044 RepID=Q9P8F6_HAPCH|nr:cephalosporin C regulator 1 [Hapsidospora chrysogena]
MRADEPAAAIQASSAAMRPQSRASTSSTHSAATQPTTDAHDYSNMPAMYGQGWSSSFSQQNHAGYSTQPPQPSQQGQTSQILLLQQASNPDAASNHFPMNGMNGHPMESQFHAHPMPAQHPIQHSQPHLHQMHAQHQMPAHALNPHTWANGESQSGMDQTGDALKDNANGLKKGKSKRRSNANNDGEMKELFESNRHKSLEEIVQDVRGNERGPNAERKRQLYAMLWLNSACVESKNSIPRGRVYHTYASKCTDDRVVVLNPASFGKLVRVVFPSIKTRRLGVRGESKYHYCNFQLRDPPPPEVSGLRDASVPAPEEAAKGEEFDFNTPPNQQNDVKGASRLPSPEDASHPPVSRATSRTSQGLGSHSRYIVPQPRRLKSGWAGGICATSKTRIKLRVATEAETKFDWDEPLVLPPIDPFLPPHTDKDAAASLVALYRAQLTSLAEAFRYIRDKSFFHLYTSFHGTLTMPVQKLFAHPSIAPWIEECDLVLYQRLTKFAFTMSLVVVPNVYLNRMRSIADRLVPHIVDVFGGHPEHVVQAKAGPAAIFVGILERMTRVNKTAHAAARPVALDANRDQMYADWLELVNARKIAECVPTRGMDDVAELLVREMRYLVDPKNYIPDDETSNADAGGARSPFAVNRWRDFLMSLPGKFPYASHEDIVWCVERVGTAIVRELTLQGGTSFTTWWSIKTFLDEEIMYLAEVGGLMHTKSLRDEPSRQQATTVVTERGQKGATADDDGEVVMGDAGQEEPMAVAASPVHTDRAPFPPKQGHAANMGDAASDAHDDSGIGIRTPETDFPVDKFGLHEAEAGVTELAYEGLDREWAAPA